MALKIESVEKDMVINFPERKIKGLVINKTSYGKYETYLDILDDKGEIQRNIRITKQDEGTFRRGLKTLALKTAIKQYFATGQIRNLRKFTSHYLGSDPEMFVTDSKGQLLPAFEFLGSKKAPDKTEQAQALFWDGFQAEFNLMPQMCLCYTVDSVHYGLSALLAKAKKKDPGAKLTINSTFDIEQSWLDNAEPEHIEFGCMPSKNAYGMKGLQRDGREVPFRSAGGHLHFGLNAAYATGGEEVLKDSNKEEQIVQFVKDLDKIVGVACVSLFAKYDDPRRRSMYGLAGEYRTPEHGLEYRVLSNAWLSHPLITHMVFELSRQTLAASRAKCMGAWEATEKETVECINNCDVELARVILKRNEVFLKNLIFSHCFNETYANKIFKTFLNGMETLIKNPDDIKGNWLLDGGWIFHSESPDRTIAKAGTGTTTNWDKI